MKIELEVPVKQTGRVQQVLGMFDVPPSDLSRTTIEIPDELDRICDEDDWQIGLIAGPSGSGKTTIAKHLLGVRLIEDFGWPADKAIVDAIDGPIRDVVKTLTAVGFGSPPAWLRPYSALSTGERFRATVARAMIEADGDVPFGIDEFTSVVDRQVAQVGSAAIQKAIRRTDRRFIAASCHLDILPWLDPDWLYRPDTGKMEWFPRGRLQRPRLRLELRSVDREAWTLFAPHHYLSSDLHVAAKCVGGFIDGRIVAFVAYYRFPHPKAKDIMINHRTVVLPDWQGLGIGGRMADEVGEMLAEQGNRFRTTLAHPALIAHFRGSRRWSEVAAQNKPSRSRKPKRLQKQHASARKLATKTFQYVPR